MDGHGNSRVRATIDLWTWALVNCCGGDEHVSKIDAAADVNSHYGGIPLLAAVALLTSELQQNLQSHLSGVRKLLDAGACPNVLSETAAARCIDLAHYYGHLPGQLLDVLA